jgi:hypothetical protein
MPVQDIRMLGIGKRPDEGSCQHCAGCNNVLTHRPYEGGVIGFDGYCCDEECYHLGRVEELLDEWATAAKKGQNQIPIAEADMKSIKAVLTSARYGKAMRTGLKQTIAVIERSVRAV